MLDLAPITRILRAKAGSQLLVAGTHYLPVFEELSRGALFLPELQERLHLKERPALVLFPALCAMGLIEHDAVGKLKLTETGKYLTAANATNLLGYVGLEKDDPGVIKMAEWLQHDGPENTQQGFSYVKDEGAPSPMDEAETARFFTMALAGRAKFLSPIVANKITKHPGLLLDVAGGTGYYTYEWLRANPTSQAIVLDRPEVLKVAAELFEEFCQDHPAEATSLKNRLTFMPGDMLTDRLPEADVLLAASLFHDWPVETCEKLAVKFAKSLKPGGFFWVHDAFLNDTLDGPIAVTDYSAMLFLGTKGRCYCRKEYRNWFTKAGLIPTTEEVPTLMDYGLIAAIKPE
ncbi:methyltransferase [Adhaeribacter pallidiroseus]|uniref:Acetylserotonin O-methyltransferase n=1 Tax=Adhaeribacter pallidiroseus TaxID=2072847 RepID=A0A369QK59_9BACT|nr:methyltransferase [Adhaeribacter pallidiroseus]RDC62648.1 Acetylserotonin O-methyltransferase [Adhaeribacter pallidiroseus]